MTTKGIVSNFGDDDLIPSNVKDGVDIFGVEGDLELGSTPFPGAGTYKSQIEEDLDYSGTGNNDGPIGSLPTLVYDTGTHELFAMWFRNAIGASGDSGYFRMYKIDKATGNLTSQTNSPAAYAKTSGGSQYYDGPGPTRIDGTDLNFYFQVTTCNTSGSGPGAAGKLTYDLSTDTWATYSHGQNIGSCSGGGTHIRGIHDLAIGTAVSGNGFVDIAGISSRIEMRLLTDGSTTRYWEVYWVTE